MTHHTPRQSAGILLYHFRASRIEVLLGHPGGPFWANKNAGAWSIPKGEFEPGKTPLIAAIREFSEETGQQLAGNLASYWPLGQVTQKSGKLVLAWAVRGELDPSLAHSNMIEIEWPPASGRKLAIPEIDRVAWFELGQAKEQINPAQAAFLDRLTAQIKANAGKP